jgi:hypothetical protein
MKRLILLLISTTFFSCSYPSKPKTEETNLNIALNETKKWVVNPEMKPLILDAEKRLN